MSKSNQAKTKGAEFAMGVGVAAALCVVAVMGIASSCGSQHSEDQPATTTSITEQ